MKERIVLFDPDRVAAESDTFQIEYGGQMTVLAIGLEEDDYVEFQAVHIPTLDPDRCACPPGVVVLPEVASYVTLQCCGNPIRITPENPVVVLDGPQRFFLRAVLHTNDTEGKYVWAIESKSMTPNLCGSGC